MDVLDMLSQVDAEQLRDYMRDGINGNMDGWTEDEIRTIVQFLTECCQAVM